MNRKTTTTTQRPESAAAHNQACNVLVGGVNSPVRAFGAVGGKPVTIREGSGSTVTDVDGNTYIDYISSYGPLILGHGHESVVAALTKATRKGTSFGMPTDAETQLAETIVAAVPSIEMIRFVNSGTEAVMSALRLARGVTGRDGIIKCAGGYHGHVDGLLVAAGSGATTLATPDSPGVPESTAQTTRLVSYNDAEAVDQILNEDASQIAAMIVEPVAGNMGTVPPEPGYLEKLRELCDAHDVLLIFDEVMTGFRVHRGGAQQRFGVMPDITVLGKVMGGGLPCAAYGAAKKIMQQLSPLGPIYQAGTLSGNPLAMAAGQATLDQLDDEAYAQLNLRSDALAEGLRHAIEAAGLPGCVQHVGPMLTLFFHDGPVRNYDDAKACDTDRFAKFFHGMLDRGIMIPPSQFEAWFPGLAHSEEDIEHTITAAHDALQQC